MNRHFQIVCGLIVVLFYIAAGDAYCQDSTKSPDVAVAAIEAIRVKHNLVGLMGGWFDADGTLIVHATGLRKADSDEPLEINDRMHLGSCTKSMTATLVGMLVDEGRLRWDTTLAEIFADEPKLVASRWSNVTLEELASHRSGAPANPAMWWGFEKKERSQRDSRRAVLQWLIKQPRKTLPSDQTRHEFLYSNVGFTILGHVVETVCDEPWEAVMQKRIFDRLDIKSAGFGPPSKLLPNQVYGHVFSDGKHTPSEIDNPPTMGPAGTVHMSLPDWAKYLRMHFELRNDKRKETRREWVTSLTGNNSNDLFLSQKQLEFLHHPKDNETYTAGWNTGKRDWAGGDILTHNGSNTMWYCVVFMSLEQNRGFFAASNVLENAPQGCDEVLQWLIKQNPR